MATTFIHPGRSSLSSNWAEWLGCDRHCPTGWRSPAHPAQLCWLHKAMAQPLCSPGQGRQLPDTLLRPYRNWREVRISRWRYHLPSHLHKALISFPRGWDTNRSSVSDPGASAAPAWDPPERKAAAQQSSKPEPSGNSPVQDRKSVV